MPNKTDIHLFEKRHHLPPFSDFKNLKEEGTRIITHAEGHTIFDSDGNAILDAMAGLWCVNVGYGRDELVNAATKQMHKLPYYNSFFKTSNEPVARLSAKLASIAPEHLNHVIYANSGSEANDTMIKMLWMLNARKGNLQKRKIITRINGYHGVTLGAASMTGKPYNGEFQLPLDGFIHADCPHYWKFGKKDETEDDFSKWLAPNGIVVDVKGSYRNKINKYKYLSL